MALWDKSDSSTTPTTGSPDTQAPQADTAPAQKTPAKIFSGKEGKETKDRADMKESFVAAGLTMEGKISGRGHVRVAGKFKGDIHVEGDLHIDADARVEGQVKAGEVIIDGELQGNIENAGHVDLKQGGTINGDIKVNTFTVAAGARMRGNVDCGFGESKPGESKLGESKQS